MNPVTENSTLNSDLPKRIPNVRDYLKTFFLGISIVIVITGYIWFISFGYWTKWDPSTYFYDYLASAFSHGSLALEFKVNPELLSLNNPYNPFERKGIDYPLDFSLYEGRYYLYFGPVPALFLVILKLFGAGQIGDPYLVFAFICAIFFFQSLIIFYIKNQFFQDMPEWIMPFCLLCIGLISPIAWMLTEARVYEVAINAGQAFFLAGLYLNITAIKTNPISPTRLFIGGISWAFAIGSRLTLVLPIAIMTFTILVMIIYISRPLTSKIKTLFQFASLCAPIFLGIMLLGWYNWARFNSVFETGFYYQLTSKNLQHYAHVLFSPIYILPNSYEYLVGQPKFLNTFPFLIPIRARGILHFPFISLPAVYYTRAITGLLYSTPFVVFAGLSIISMIPKVAGGINKSKPVDKQPNLLPWIIAGLLGSFLAGFLTVASYFWVEARFFNDFLPSLILLSMIGFFLGCRIFTRRPVLRSIYITFGIGLMLISIIASNLLVFGIRGPAYKDWNPTLWNQLNNLFMP